MAYWILKTEPSTYSFDDLVKAGRAVWDGVTNPVALKNLRNMVVGDEVMIYHTGSVKAAVGYARVVRVAYPDPKAGDPKLVVVDLEAGHPIRVPVTLAAVKADPEFAAFDLVRLPRLSVIPVPVKWWWKLVSMGA
jgi:predicted RNA-binding protein with PUA-like domain